MTRQPDPDPIAIETGAPAPDGLAFAREDVLRTYDAIIASGVLGTSDRRALLLRYLVGQELDGLGAEIKAFSIAIDVLDRDASFDPNTDSIVRSEVGRLRDALRLYFADMASGDDVTIEIPKGTYRPSFSVEAPARRAFAIPGVRRSVVVALCVAVLVAGFGAFYTFVPSNQPEAVPARVPLSDAPYELVRIAIAPFSGTGTNANVNELAFGIFSELSLGLSAYPWISVVSPVGGIDTLDSDAVDYVLIGDVHWDTGTILTSARLVGIDDQTVIWANSQRVNAEPKAIRESVARVTSQISRELGSVHGIAPALVTRQNAHSSPEHLTAFLCFLGSYAYVSEPTDARHLALRTCLLDAVDEFPGFGDGWAALALVYIDEARFDRNARPGQDPWQDAKNAIDQALIHAPLRMPTLNVALIHSIEAPERDHAAFERYASLLLHLYSRHPMTLNNVGSRLAEFTGQWDRGLALIDEAIFLEIDPPSAFYVTRAYWAAKFGTAQEALASVAPLTGTTSESQLLLKYLAAGRNSLRDDMQNIRQLLRAQGLSENSEIVQHIENRRYVEDLEVALIDQLESTFRTETGQ